MLLSNEYWRAWEIIYYQWYLIKHVTDVSNNAWRKQEAAVLSELSNMVHYHHSIANYVLLIPRLLGWRDFLINLSSLCGTKLTWYLKRRNSLNSKLRNVLKQLHSVLWVERVWIHWWRPWRWPCLLRWCPLSASCLTIPVLPWSTLFTGTTSSFSTIAYMTYYISDSQYWMRSSIWIKRSPLKVEFLRFWGTKYWN